MMRNLPQLANVVQRNCDISDARHAGDYGLCTFLLKMREYYRWENELPFERSLPREDLGDWLKAREQAWDRIEADEFAPLPLARGELDPFDAEAANGELLPQGCVYSAGYGRSRKPVFFLGRLLRVEQRAGRTIRISSCEYARELAAPPAMLQGRTSSCAWSRCAAICGRRSRNTSGASRATRWRAPWRATTSSPTRKARCSAWPTTRWRP
jgi:hypothetical protein